MATKSELAALAVVDALHELGWVDDGQTDTQTVRIPTSKCPVYGRGAYGGGEVRTFGGRERLAKPGTEWKVTVGTRSVNFYRVGEIKTPFKGWDGQERVKTSRGAIDFQGFNTTDLEGIKARASALS